MTARSSRSDDTEDPIFEVTPTDNVYSYFMFISPTEQKKEQASFTTDILMAYLLIFVNFFMQGILIYAVFNEVVVENVEWQGEVMALSPTESGIHLFGPPPEDGTCFDGGSLCFLKDGHYSCAPPSVQLTGRWNELDVDGDDIWTREEVMEQREVLKCKYAVDPLEVFDVFHSFLLKREEFIWLHPDVKAGKAIHRPYFTYATGDIIMCGYRNNDFCPNLVQRGFFDAPMKYGTAPRVGTSIDSALDYCYDLLRPGGACERTLPSTYSVWKIESVEQCKDPKYEKFTYTNPGNNVTKSLLAVDYKARQRYERASTSLLFKLYKGIVMALWLLCMLVEFKEITMVITWVLRFPNAADFPEGEAVKEEPDPADPGEVKYIIQGITTPHRMAVGLLILLRLIMTAILCWVGVSFLSKQMDYIDLLMDGVAMIFICEISSVLYAQVLRPDIRDQTESLEPMRVLMYGNDFLNRRPAIVDMLCCLSILGLVVALMYLQYAQMVLPVFKALECTCTSAGKSCFEAQHFDYKFWHNYWYKEVPGVFRSVKQLNGTLPPDDPATASGGETVGLMNRVQMHMADSTGDGSVPTALVHHTKHHGDATKNTHHHHHTHTIYHHRHHPHQRALMLNAQGTGHPHRHRSKLIARSIKGAKRNASAMGHHES